MDRKTYKLNDFTEPIAVAVTDPQKSCHNIFVGLEHYDSGEPVISRFSDTSLLNSSCKEFQKNDILIARRNVYLKRAGIAPFDGLTSGDSIVLRLFMDCEKKTGIPYDVAIRIIPFVLNSNSFWTYANRHADGMNSKRISKEKVLDYEFELPSIEEQKVLAEKLWAAYEVKQSYLNMIETTEEMVKSQFTEMFGTIDDPKCKTDYLPSISENLDSRRVPIKSGSRKKGKYPYYGASGIVDYVADFIFDENILLISEDGANLKDRVTPIAFSSSGKVWVNNHAHVLKFEDAALQLFVEYYFNFNKIDSYLTGTAQPKLNQDKLNSIPIPIPNKEYLHKFVTIAQQADKSISELRNSIDAIDKVIKSLINENL